MSQPNYPNYDQKVYDLLPEFLKAAYLRECEWNNACPMAVKGNDGKSYIIISGINVDVSAIDAGQPTPLQISVVPGRLVEDSLADRITEEHRIVTAGLQKLLDIYNGKDRPPLDPSFSGFPPSGQLIPILESGLGITLPQYDGDVSSIAFNIIRQQGAEEGEEIVGNPLPIVGFQAQITPGWPPRTGNEQEIPQLPTRPLTPEEEMVYSTIMFFLIDLVFPLLGQAIALGIGVPALIAGAEQAHKEGRLIEYIAVNAAIVVVGHAFINTVKSAVNTAMNAGEMVVGKGDTIGDVKKDLPGGGRVKVLSEYPYIIEFPSGRGTTYTATRVHGTWRIIAEVPEGAGAYADVPTSTNAIVTKLGLDLATLPKDFPIMPENPTLGSGSLGFPNWPLTGWDFGGALAEVPTNNPVPGGSGSSTLNVPKPMIEFLDWFNGQKLIVVNPNNFPGWPKSELAEISSSFASNLSMSQFLGVDLPTPFGAEVPKDMWTQWFREHEGKQSTTYKYRKPPEGGLDIEKWIMDPNNYKKKLADYAANIVRQQVKIEKPDAGWSEGEVYLKIEKPDGSGYYESNAYLDISNLKKDALAGTIPNVKVEGSFIIIPKDADLTGYYAIEVKTSARGETVTRSEGQMRNQIEYLPMLAVRGMQVIWVVETTLSDNAKKAILENVKMWDKKADINSEGDIITTSGGSISFVENYKVGAPVFHVEDNGG